MRLTKKVFHDLAIWMLLFGLGVGLVFPFLGVVLGVDLGTALTAKFFAACLVAGAVVGISSYHLTKVVVGTRLRMLAASISKVKEKLETAGASGDMRGCTPEGCAIPVDSEDEIGESSLAFNHLVQALAQSMETEHAVRAFSDVLSSKLELEVLAQNAPDLFRLHTGASGGAILVEADGELSIAASMGLKDAGALVRNDFVEAAIRTGERQTVDLPT